MSKAVRIRRGDKNEEKREREVNWTGANRGEGDLRGAPMRVKGKNVPVKSLSRCVTLTHTHFGRNESS